MKTKWQVINALGKKGYNSANLTYQSESLLGLTRTVQHIDDRWLDDVQFIEINNNERLFAKNGQIARRDPQTGQQVRVPLEIYLQQTGASHRVFASVNAGALQINGKPASYNDVAKATLADFTQGPVADALDKINLAIEDHRFLQDGKEVSIEVFGIAVEQQASVDSQFAATVLPLRQNLQLLKSTLMTSFGPVKLGEDEYFMVGDNRNNSHDSRYFGPVKRSEITGEAFGVAFSFKDNKMFAIPPEPAWERWFKDLD